MKFHIFLHNKWPNLIFITLFSLWFISLFIAPSVIPPNTIQDLDGHSTIINHNDKWENLSIYPRIIYTIGDFLCHQKDNRCFEINNNQMPVCVRCFAVYLGFIIALFFTLSISNSLSKNDYLLKVIPYNLREKLEKKFGIKYLPLILIGVFLIPVAIDGGLQLFTSYESVNILRILSGFPAGFIGGVILGAIINT
jgi:uncharacterized membrane protein